MEIKILGYVSSGKESLAEKIIKQGLPALLSCSGNYAVVIQNGNEHYIATSPYGAYQYYYTTVGNRLFHDDTVIGVLGKSKLPWRWDFRALSDLAQLDHLLGDDTLHPEVKRVPAGSILHFKNGVLTISSLEWEQLNPYFNTTPEAALDLFNHQVKQWAKDDSVVSMSGGFDSRLILSSFLKIGYQPLLLVMGFDNSTDVVIGRNVATKLNLPILTVTVNSQDYLRHASRIVTLTNGTKTASHWHTFIYSRKAGLAPARTVFIGSNGEFARTYYLDKGIISRAADLIPQFSLREFWKRKLKFIFNNAELKGLHDEFSAQFYRKQQNCRIERIVRLCHNKLLSGLDRFYLEQRVKNFIGNGLRLYAENFAWRTPFLDREWVNSIYNLKRCWKQGANWHRFAIARNFPRLLNFPEEGKAAALYPRAPFLYWLPSKKKYPIIPYADYNNWFRECIFEEFIRDNISLLSGLAKPSLVSSILNENKKSGNRTRTVAFLLTMAFWLKNLKEQGCP